MDRLWRPWRMSYIREGAADRTSDCFLCTAAEAEPDSLPQLRVLSRGIRVLAVLNQFPYNTGHLMVSPLRHVGELDALSPEESSAVWGWVTAAVRAHRRVSEPQGFNIGVNLGSAAGAGVPGHLHVHVVPRWDGDTNFMPVIADAKVLPEMLDETYEALRPALDAELPRGG